MTDITPRINGARMNDYIGRTVRLICKVTKVVGNTALVEATDGATIEVAMTPGTPTIEDYAEIVGTVVTDSKIKMMTCINMGQELDMTLANDLVELIHGPQKEIKEMFF
ncbi:replication factor A protein 3 [Thelephora terrestris]|uniref:Replication factor A protein 3 n=1 Tax=Thelephora terrestris TaxID=56493 RepID=A0A9P6HK72_9AGAM|nr:replication factor A protein 3 [Thelephora terrestris]